MTFGVSYWSHGLVNGFTPIATCDTASDNLAPVVWVVLDGSQRCTGLAPLSVRQGSVWWVLSGAIGG